MFLPFTYNPTTDDLWLYRDETIVYNGGATSLTRPTAYAWNPTSKLYGYRRSLEGLQLTRRTLSTSFDLTDSPYGAFTSDPGGVNAYTTNSYPPRGYVFHPRLSMHCSHCYSVSTINYPGTDSSFRNRYVPDQYLSSVMLFRFIDGDNNIHEYSDIGPLWNAFSGTRFCGGDSNDWVYTNNLGTEVAGSRATGHDFSISILPTAFPFTPMVIANPGYLGEGCKIWVVDCNGKICDGYEAWQFQTGSPLSYSTVNGFTLLSNGKYELSDEVQLHDSGNIFLVEVSPPTSTEAGDGVLAVLGSLNYAGTRAHKGIFKYDYETNSLWKTAAGPVTLVPYSHTTMLSPTDLSNFNNIGYPNPFTFVDITATGRVVATESKAQQVKQQTLQIQTLAQSLDERI